MQTWLTVQLLLALLWLGLRLAPPLPARSASLAARGLLLAALALPALGGLAPAGPLRPAAQVWSGAVQTAAGLPTPTGGTVGATLSGAATSLDGAGHWLLLASVLLGLPWLALQLVGLRRLLSRTLPWRRLGGLDLRLGDRSCAVRLPGRRVVVLDASLLPGTDGFRLALLHEGAHHRRGDPAFAWLLLVVRAAAVWNPFVHLLARELTALDELATDAAVLARGVPARSYGRALLDVTASAPAPAAALHHPTLLHRRIHMLTHRPRRLVLPLSALLGLLLVSVAGAASDGHVRPELVKAADAASTEAFPIPANDVVWRSFHRFVDNADGATFLRDGLHARAGWSELVDGALAEAGLPQELAAVPLIESGYVNLGAGEPGESAAPGVPGKGLWMFIPSTARAYGLRVDDARDDRLDPTLETAAAVRLLSDLHAEFGDWGLALAGYNQGAAHVRAAIAEHGTRDVWELVEVGALNRYVPMVAVAVMALRDPALVAE